MASMQPVSVLVVEDDRQIGRLIKCNLEDKVTRVVEANSGFDCISILRENKFDLIMLDIRLPDFNGWGILSLLKLTEPFRDIPVIMVSVEPPNTELIERFKPADYVQKPFDIRDLLARVKKVIGAKRNSEQVTTA